MSASEASPAAILLDIEGTTTPIAFVSDVLFPYARVHLRGHLEQHAGVPEYETLLGRLKDDREAERQRGEAVPAWVDAPDAARRAAAAAYVDWLMDRDRKSPPLKELQGRIWELGFHHGELVGEVFPDVPPALRRWHARGLPVAIYSSGSVQAQQLLFRHSSAGDLTRFLRAYFDTGVGAKADPDSYRGIARAIGRPPASMLFLSDSARELAAARAAGMQVRLSIRPGNSAPPADHDFPSIASFDEVG